jgi:CheY-like chemotaxis protein
MGKLPSNDYSILIVDDIPKNIQVLGSLLQNDKYSIEFALDGQTALEWVEKKDFDLVLLDVMMPEMNGFEVCRIIKANPETQKVPVIFITANNHIESTIEGFMAGAADYVTKPFNKEELLARVSTHLELKRSRDEIEKKNELITDSIEYARSIQNAVMQSSNNLIAEGPEHFIYFKPKDIVSGDFYWLKSVDNKIIIAVMDCTGHGVPGAFMSMLGITLLNEVVIREKIIRPDKILNRLREQIIDTLGQKGISLESRDGMDGSIISLDQQNRLIEYSGANNHIYLIRNNEITKLIVDRMPLAYSENMADFNVYEIQIEKNDMIYLFTDGFADQFGGEHNKKFMSTSFKRLLLDNHEKALTEQGQILDNKFSAWKGDGEQIDDVLVLGMRL